MSRSSTCVGGFDLSLHAAEKLVHHHPAGWDQHPLTNAGNHAANLAVTRHVDVGSFVDHGKSHHGVALDESRSSGTVDQETVSCRCRLVSDLHVAGESATDGANSGLNLG